MMGNLYPWMFGEKKMHLAGASSLAQAQTLVHGNLEHLRRREMGFFLVAILVGSVVESREYYETTNF